jgi:hypothetical protein
LALFCFCFAFFKALGSLAGIETRKSFGILTGLVADCDIEVEAKSSSSSFRDLVTPAAAFFSFRFGFYEFFAGICELLASRTSSDETNLQDV